jgi:hypothetical protein
MYISGGKESMMKKAAMLILSCLLSEARGWQPQA